MGKLDRYERVVLRVIVFLIMVLISAMLYTSCSATFIKGQGNSSNTTISTKADDAKIDVLDRSKRAKASNNKGGIKIGAKDTVITKDTIKEDEKTKVIDSIDTIDTVIDSTKSK